MRKFLLILGFFYSTIAYTSCAPYGFDVFPKGKYIKQNSIFIIDGYMLSQKVILELNKKDDIYLKSGDKKINLLVVEICVGQFRFTQAILKPETELEVDKTYTLIIDNLSVDNELSRYNSKTQKHELITYIVTDQKDFIKPKVLKPSKVIKKTLAYFGCGPEIYVDFNNPTKDESEIMVKTTLKSLKTGKETTYYLEPNGNQISVGHGMCAGAFTFDDGKNYEVAFSFIDASGNITKWKGKRIKFTKPIKPIDYN